MFFGDIKNTENNKKKLTNSGKVWLCSLKRCLIGDDNLILCLCLEKNKLLLFTSYLCESIIYSYFINLFPIQTLTFYKHIIINYSS